MEKSQRKELIFEYKARKIVGAVYSIKNTMNGKELILYTVNLEGSKNRFAFSQKTGGCENLKLREDWKKFGTNAFIFQVLEEIEMGEGQTQKEFLDDLKTLHTLWIEKTEPAILY